MLTMMKDYWQYNLISGLSNSYVVRLGVVFLWLSTSLVAWSGSGLPVFCQQQAPDAGSHYQYEHALSFLAPLLSSEQSSCWSALPGMLEKSANLDWRLSAEHAILNFRDDPSSLQGAVDLHTPHGTWRSEKIWLWRDAHQRPTRWCAADGITWLNASFGMLQARQLYYDYSQDFLRANDVYFVLAPSNSGRYIWGWAQSLQAEKKQQHRVMHHVRLTTCRPERMHWYIKAPVFEVDDANQQGVFSQPEFYFLGKHWFSLPRYRMYFRPRKVSWLPRIDYSFDEGWRLLLDVHMGDFRIEPYISTRSWLGLQLYHRLEQTDISSQAAIQWSSQAKYIHKPIYYYSGKYDLSTQGQLSWRWLQAARSSSLGFLPDSVFGFIRPNQPLARFLRWQHDGENQYAIELRHHRRFAGQHWSVDQFGLPAYDFLPSMRFVHLHPGIKSGLQFSTQLDDLSLPSSSPVYPQGLRVLSYLGYDYYRAQNRLATHLGAWWRLSHLHHLPTPEASLRQYVLPKINMRWQWLAKPKVHAWLDYCYVPYIEQSAEPNLTTSRWYWRDEDVHALTYMDRLMDQHWLSTRFQVGLMLGGTPWDLTWQHRWTLKPTRIWLSDDGAENPYVRYPAEVSRLQLYSSDKQWQLDGLWVWPQAKWHALQLQWRRDAFTVFALTEPGVLLQKDNKSFMTVARIAGLKLPVFRNSRHNLELVLDYMDNSSRYFGYRLRWQYDDCCLHAVLDVSGRQIVRGQKTPFHLRPRINFSLSF